MDVHPEQETEAGISPAPPVGAAPPSPPSPPLLISWLIAAALVVAVAVLRFGVLPHQVLPVAYGVPLVACVALRRRSILWAMVLAFSAISLAKFVWLWHGDPDYP